jgi:iron complex outermembrane receptor protein
MTPMSSIRTRGLYCAAAALTAIPAHAHEPSQPIDIAATVLPDAIAELAREADVSIGAEGALPRVAVHRVHGTMPPGRALGRMLAGSGYRARKVGARAWRIEPARVHTIAPGERVEPAPPVPRAMGSEIIVTATKEVLPLADVPGAIAVAEPATAPVPAAAAGTGTVAEAIEGLALTGEGAGRNRMFVRGVADSAFAGRNQSTVAVLIGDARVTWSARLGTMR